MRRFNYCFISALIASFLSLFSTSLFSLETDRVMTITLQTNDQESVDIGQITFTSENKGYRYQFVLDEEKFEKQFLSMRPFLCMQKPKMMVCHLPYPYENKQFISADNMIDLEYELMFLFKQPGAYGIDPWNGIYYKMHFTENGIEGVAHDVDMNVLTVPPEEGNLRPITPDLLYTVNLAKHWFPLIKIH